MEHKFIYLEKQSTLAKVTKSGEDMYSDAYASEGVCRYTDIEMKGP